MERLWVCSLSLCLLTTHQRGGCNSVQKANSCWAKRLSLSVLVQFATKAFQHTFYVCMCFVCFSLQLSQGLKTSKLGVHSQKRVNRNKTHLTLTIQCGRLAKYDDTQWQQSKPMITGTCKYHKNDWFQQSFQTLSYQN